MMKILFITDGGGVFGMGHIQQSLTLAQELQDRAEVAFLTKSDRAVVKQIEDAGFKVSRRSNDSEILADLTGIMPHLVIIDKIDVEEDFARRIREDLKIRLAIFTNVTSANRYANIAVTADYGSRFTNIRYFDESTGTLYYYGPKFWVLRKEFYERKKKAGSAPAGINKILLIFGGSDPLNLTSAVLDELLSLDRSFRVDAILGAGFTWDGELGAVMDKHDSQKKRVSLWRNVRNVAEMMFQTDLVLASPGLSLFEALAVGTPAIALHQNELQAEAYKGLIPTLDKKEVKRLAELLDNRVFINPYDDFIAGLEIGQGKEELVDLLLDNGKMRI
jgi:spore coat polysaccharide biosynthesis predicted glycosyltransferase SpsG